MLTAGLALLTLSAVAIALVLVAGRRYDRIKVRTADVRATDALYARQIDDFDYDTPESW